MKRTLDLVIGGAALLLLSPLLLILAAVIRVTLGSPILFPQERTGLNGCPFLMYKFRTMSNAVDRTGALLPDAQRITKVGRLIRRTSLDELPELFHVLKGEMSLVGPRPLLPRYLDRYTKFQFRRHEVLPGITGWSQVKGRNRVSWEERFRQDVWYVDHRTLGLDLKILGLTVWSVISRKGVSPEGQETMEEFMGSSTPGHPMKREGSECSRS